MDQVDALVVVLRSMMPPSEGAQKVRGPPPEAMLEKSELIWSEHDARPSLFTSFYQRRCQGLHVRATREPPSAAELRGRICPEGRLCFRGLSRSQSALRTGLTCFCKRTKSDFVGALDLAVAYLKNYAVDKADALYTATEPFCA